VTVGESSLGKALKREEFGAAAPGRCSTCTQPWQKTFFETGSAAFEGGRSPSRVLGQNERKLEALEGRLRSKDEVIAEIMEALVRQKRSFGTVKGPVGTARSARPGGGFPQTLPSTHRPSPSAAALKHQHYNYFV
jgi:hypothetical protein